MASFNSRDIAYILYSRFEPIFRRIVCSGMYQVASAPVDLLTSPLKEKVRVRAKENPVVDLEDYIELTDLPDLVEIVGSLKLPAFSRINADRALQRRFNEITKEVYQLRCRIAHARDIFGDYELNQLISGCREILAVETAALDEFNDAIEEVKKSASLGALLHGVAYLEEGGRLKAIPNNLPVPDFTDDGGFVGRSDEVSKISDLLKRYQVVTIAGAGGVGKTALAQKVVHESIERGAFPVDGVVWCSAKENRLSYLGIEEFEPDIRSLGDLLDRIMLVMGMECLVEDSILEKETKVRKLVDNYRNILVVLDNLETIDDAGIIDFIVEAPESLKFLLTSRRGLGQVERRYEVKALKSRDAIHLFRTVARSRSVKYLAELNDDVIANYVERLSWYPLIIKWAIGHVALGRDIEEVFHRVATADDDIARFCFDFIYGRLSPDAKKVIASVCVLDDQGTPGMIKYVSNLSDLAFADAVRELLLVSLLIQEGQKDQRGQIARRFSVLSLTRAYVRRVLQQDIALRSEIDERWRLARLSINEAEAARSALKFSLLSSGADSEEEKIAVVLASTASQKMQAGLIEEGVALFRKALSVAPHFYAIYRSWAIAESSLGHYSEADDLIRRALEVNPKDANSWLTWAQIKRRSGHTRDALKYCEEAFKLAPRDRVVLSTLGHCCLSEKQFERASLLILESLNMEGGGVEEAYHRRINSTALASVYLGWAMDLLEGSDQDTAISKLEKAYAIVNEIGDAEPDDYIYINTRMKVTYVLAHCTAGENSTRAISLLSEILEREPVKYFQVVAYVKAALLLAGLYFSMGCKDEALEIINLRVVRRAKLTGKDQALELRVEEVKRAISSGNWICARLVRADKDGRYVIVSPEFSTDTVLIPALSFLVPYRLNRVSWIGKVVKYVLYPQSDGGKARYVANIS